MQELQVTIDGDSMKLAPPFMVFATQNPIESKRAPTRCPRRSSTASS
ncbi:MAG: AAA family ATPase [Verrucomicrobiales bacterium]